MKIKALFAPHALAAIAALIPRHFDVKIFDEAVHGPVEDHLKTSSYSLIGIHLTTNLLKRCIDIGTHIRNNYSVMSISCPDNKIVFSFNVITIYYDPLFRNESRT